MRTEKVSLTLNGELLAEAREIVGSRKLSSYVNHALHLQVQHDRIAGLLADLEEEKGPIENGVMEEVRKGMAFARRASQP
jgi:hypothetical protein